MWMDKLPLARFLGWLRGVLSEPDGTPSSTRVLLFVFSGFSMWLLWRCFYHIFQLTDITQITLWLSQMPVLITALMGFIALPYTINKGTSALSDIASLMTAAKTNKVVPNLPTARTSVTPAPAPPAPAVSPAKGSAGIKG